MESAGRKTGGGVIHAPVPCGGMRHGCGSELRGCGGKIAPQCQAGRNDVVNLNRNLQRRWINIAARSDRSKDSSRQYRQPEILHAQNPAPDKNMKKRHKLSLAFRLLPEGFLSTIYVTASIKYPFGFNPWGWGRSRPRDWRLAERIKPCPCP